LLLLGALAGGFGDASPARAQPAVTAPSAVASAKQRGLAPTAPSVSAAPAASASPARGTVLLGDTPVFSLRVPRAERSAEERAVDATRALAETLREEAGADVRVERRKDAAVVLFGRTPIVHLYEEDALAAGDASLDVHAASVAASLRAAVDSETRRSAVAKSVFSISLVVFLGLVALYLLRKIGEFSQRGRAFVAAHTEGKLAIRIKRIEVVSPATVRNTALVTLSAGRWFAQAGILYTWLVVAFSLFEPTRGYTERLTGFVTHPLSELTRRVAVTLPVLAVLAIAAFAVFVLVRFVELFFLNVERGETSVSWLPADLAGPTSIIVRFAIVLCSLVFLAPLVTGSSEGSLSRVGLIGTAALALSATPLLANALAGSVMLFGRRLKPGLHVEVDGRRGRISAIGLLDLRIEGADRSETRFPHLWTLWRPLTVLGVAPRHAVVVSVAASAHRGEVREILLRIAARIGREPLVEVVEADPESIFYRVSLISEAASARAELERALFDGLADAAVPFGRATTSGVIA
jgi:hypothetical protein